MLPFPVTVTLSPRSPWTPPPAFPRCEAPGAPATPVASIVSPREDHLDKSCLRGKQPRSIQTTQLEPATKLQDRSYSGRKECLGGRLDHGGAASSVAGNYLRRECVYHHGVERAIALKVPSSTRAASIMISGRTNQPGYGGAQVAQGQRCCQGCDYSAIGSRSACPGRLDRQGPDDRPQLGRARSGPLAQELELDRHSQSVGEGITPRESAHSEVARRPLGARQPFTSVGAGRRNFEKG
jgi:hypothetical protein